MSPYQQIRELWECCLVGDHENDDDDDDGDDDLQMEAK